MSETVWRRPEREKSSEVRPLGGGGEIPAGFASAGGIRTAVDPDSLSSSLIDDEMVTVYTLLLEGHHSELSDLQRKLRWSEHAISEVLTRLMSMRLVRRRETDHRYIANRPHAVAAQAVSSLKSRVHVLQSQAEQIRGNLAPLMPLYRAASGFRRPGELADVLPDRESRQAMLDEAAAECDTGLRIIHVYDDTDPEDGGRGPLREAALLERGVTVQVLYPHSLWYSRRRGEYAERLRAAGAHVRTSRDVASGVTIFDRRVAFIASGEGAEERGGVSLLHDAGLVALLHEVFDFFWEGATEVHPGGGQGPEEQQAVEATKRSIVRLLVQGHRDDTIARRLSISVRTCRRHIAEIMESTGANSRFQAGYLIAGRQLLDGRD